MKKLETTFAPKKMQFVKQLSAAAREASKTFGLNPSMILAQSAIETGWGTSSYAVNHHNYFGVIACGKPGNYWKGSKSRINARGLCFRHYASAEQSFMDYGRLLRAQYPKAATLSFHPESFAREISYSAYICEGNGDNREHYRKMLIAIEQDIRDIMDHHDW